MASVVPDSGKLRDIDSLEKNKFRYEWLAKTVKLKFKSQETDVLVEDCVKKVDVSGKAICSLCNDFIYYGKRGFAAISDHLKTKKHIEKFFLKKTNYALPSNFFGASPASISGDLTIQPSSSIPAVPHNVPLGDRISNGEALVLGVLAEHNLPFSMAEVLIDVSKTLSEDKKALNHLNMKRASATYKMRFGVAKTFSDATIENLRKLHFSLNIDEATSTNNMRVLSLLCSYYSPDIGRVVIEHLTSLSVITVTAENLFNAICMHFEEKDIPWINVMSILLDSCNVMRGSKTGLETRIRSCKAPHLLDVDGDSCHHIHNACKAFCKPFNKWLENLSRDVYNDIKWSADIKNFLIEICSILNIKYVSPVLFIPHRWMSSYDAALNVLYLFDALTLLYFSFMKNCDQQLYFSILCSIYLSKGLSSSDRARVKAIQKKLAEKNMTDDGQNRKKRIFEKLFFYRKQTMLTVHFYSAVLPQLKQYVMLFQTKEPLIHKVYYEQKQLFLNFLSCYVTPEVLQIKNPKDLLQIDLGDETIYLPSKRMFLGLGTQSLLPKGVNEICDKFLSTAKEAYIECGKYLQKKLPLDNHFLKCVSAINPSTRGQQITCERLQKLPSIVTNVLSLEEKEKYQLEIFQYQVDLQLPPPLDTSGNDVPVDVWWSKVFLMPKYSGLSKMVKAILSCFHGPQVESSFSMMSEIVDKKSGKMEIQTFSAIQTVKYRLLSEKKTSVDFFKKKDYLHQPVDRNLCYNLKSSRMNYQKELDKKKKIADEKSKQAIIPMKKKLEEVISVETASRLKHKRKLELMVQKLKKKRLQ